MEEFPRDKGSQDELETLYKVDSYRSIIEDLESELKTLLGSWEFAFAMGDSHGYGDHAQHRAVRERVDDLKARIAELKE
jgi:hypothetical protein